MLSDKKLARIEKILDEDTIKTLHESSYLEIHAAIVAADSSMKKAAEELEANPKYQELKENLKALSEGFREVKKRQNAIVQYSLHLLEEMEEMDGQK